MRGGEVGRLESLGSGFLGSDTALPPITCVALEKFLNLSVPQFPHLSPTGIKLKARPAWHGLGAPQAVAEGALSPAMTALQSLPPPASA